MGYKTVSDEKLLQSLLVCGGVRGAATDLNISETAIYKRLKEPAFRAQYDSMCGAVLAAAISAMTLQLDKAVGALAAILDDTTATPGAKVNAANVLLAHTNRYIEAANILRRLDALEIAQSGNK